MARHAVVDMSRVFNQQPRPPSPDRLPPSELNDVRKALAASGHVLPEDEKVDNKLNRLRLAYEPYLNALGNYLLMPLPQWRPREPSRDNWQGTA